MDTMDMVKVDPKLFVTCRLCLKEMGMYQITPAVQMQIKYCFDIEVNQFDGLPQLICGECETILSEYFMKKRLFVGLQNALKAKLEVRKELDSSLCPSPPHEAVSSSQQNDNDSLITSGKPTPKSKKRKARIISSSSSSDCGVSRKTSSSPAIDNKSDPQPDSQKSKDKTRSRGRRESWEVNYTKKYGCKLCTKTFKYGGGYKNHIRKHANLLSKYQNIIQKTCKVELIKIDNKLNPTGTNETVALSEDKILGEQKEHIYIVYSSKNLGSNTVNNGSIISDATCVDSDDSSLNVPKSQQVKRRRLTSRSSYETVILKDECKPKLQPLNHCDIPVECINIDDSSNSSHQSDCVSVKYNNSAPIKPKDVEVIKNLIRVCHNKYVSKKQEMIETDTKKAASKDPKLKHKLLSMGRKVINKKGLACTGLLRFMENKELAVKWIPMISSQKDSNYVRIMPRLKGKEELSMDNIGWKKCPEDLDRPVKILQVKNDKNNSNENNEPKNGSCDVISVSESLKTNYQHEANSNVTSTDKSPTLLSSDKSPTLLSTDKSPTLLSLYLTLENNSDKKLLNANPVANPKQLPKKYTTNDSKVLPSPAHMAMIELKSVPQANADKQEPICIDLDDDNHPQKDMCMPIIMSTTSLAGATTDDKNSSLNGNDNPAERNNENATSSSENNADGDNPAAPRIKVKPASELMSERVLKNLGQQQSVPTNIWNQPNMNAPVQTQLGLNITHVMSAGVPVAASSVVSTSNSNAFTSPHSAPSYVILDTVELPNTKAESPIQYFRTLLQIHGIVLLDSHEPLPPNAVCLIKFKLQFVRDNMNQLVTLCLSVHNAGNVFALGVRDPNHLNPVILNNLNANWQWEILKVYTVREDVINKMLQSAQKVGQAVYEYTKSFLCLLKSINVKKIEQSG